MDKQPHICAQFLASSRYLVWFNAFIFVIAFIGAEDAWGKVIHLLLALILLYLHIRLDFDRRIFADFAQNGLQPEEFDAVLHSWGWLKNRQGREMQQRVLGAFKLWRYLLWATGIQVGWLVWHSI